ncbi:MAG: PEGA domain-containing protein [Bacteroidales bacterium]|nr:PEGA domain-containing protein [Bacteroidales bacterium]
MKRYFVWIMMLWVVCGLQALPAAAQNLKMSLAGEVRLEEEDMDATSYYPVRDQNDKLCALIKVRCTNELKNPLALDNRGLGVTKRQEMDNGEYWFWVPYQTKNLYFACKGYEEVPPIPVQLQPGKVYRITLRTDAVAQTILNASISFNYLRMNIVPQGARVSIGDTEDCSLYSEIVTQNDFEYQLNYGRYYYRIEHPEYETITGQVEVSEEDQEHQFTMTPAYSYLTFESDPVGADVFVNGKHIGTTPFRSETRYLRGELEVLMQKREYASRTEKIQVRGQGGEQTVHMALDALFATVTCTCEDPQAEIWVDNVYQGTGSWTGHLSTTSNHVLEARKAGCQARSISFEVKEGEVVTKTVEAPIPFYAILSIQSTPTAAFIFLDGEEIGKTPKVKQVLVGKHQITLTKEGHFPVAFEVELKHNQQLTVAKELKPIKAENTTPQATVPKKQPEKKAAPKEKAQKQEKTQKQESKRRLFAELNYGIGSPSKSLNYPACSKNHWGGTFGYIPNKWGGYISGLCGAEYSDITATAGVIYRPFSKSADLQLYAGAGIFTGYRSPVQNASMLQFLGDVGVRLGLDVLPGQFQCLSLSFGCKFCSKCVIPTFGIAISLQK